MTLQIGIYDHTTGEQLTRDMTSQELSAYQAELEKRASDKAARAAKKQEAKEALLSSLGITEEQAIILGLIQPPFVAKETGAE
jgi:hypothetical protein